MEGVKGQVLREELVIFLKDSKGGGFEGVYLEGSEWKTREPSVHPWIGLGGVGCVYGHEGVTGSTEGFLGSWDSGEVQTSLSSEFLSHFVQAARLRL